MEFITLDILQPFISRGVPNFHSPQLKYSSEGFFFFYFPHRLRANPVMTALEHEFQNVNTTKEKHQRIIFSVKVTEVECVVIRIFLLSIPG